MDHYWDSIMRSRGINPAWLASRYYLRYAVVSGRSIQEVEKNFNEYLSRINVKREVILSPWLGFLAEKIPQLPTHWSALNMHGLESEFISLRTVALSRDQVLKEIAQSAIKENKNILFLYKNVDDYNVLSGMMEEGVDLFSLPINAQIDINQSIEQAVAIMALREIQTLIIFAEPWNFLIINGLSLYMESIQHVYSTGVVAGHNGVTLVSDEIDTQIKALLGKKIKTIEAEIEK
ncbi:MAG: hypothetical protein ACRCVN_03935 [Spirochaetia bacterium]